MNHSATTPAPTCTASQFDDALKLVGDFWTLRILDAIRDSEMRFCGLERAIPDVSPATLTGRIKKLEDAGVIERRIATCDKQSVSYALTHKGEGILPVLDAIKAYTIASA